MNIAIIVLLILAAVSLGLRTTSLLAGRMHPLARLAAALAAGAVLTLAILEISDSYRVFEFGLGLLISLSPVGVFDAVKWWYRWGR